MSAFDELLSPDLEEVLRDLEQLGTSKLLRVTPAQAARSLAMGWNEVSVAQAGLATVERHLLDVHRAELAWVLREAYLIHLYSAEDTGTLCVHEGELTTAEELRRDATHLTELGESEPGVSVLLHSIAGGSVGVTFPLEALLQASLRIERAPSALSYLASEHYCRGRIKAASFSAGRLLNWRPDPLVRLAAHQTRAAALDAQGRESEAAAEFRLAWLLAEREGSVEAQVCVLSSLLANSAQSGNSSECEVWLRELDERAKHAGRLISDIAAQWSAARGGPQRLRPCPTSTTIHQQASGLADACSHLIDALYS